MLEQQTWHSALVQSGDEADIAYPFGGISFVDKLHGWLSLATRDRGIVFRTEDGGNTWKPISHVPIVLTQFGDRMNGWALPVPAGDAGTLSLLGRATPVLVTRDSGITWHPIVLPNAEDVDAIVDRSFGESTVSQTASPFPKPNAALLVAHVRGDQLVCYESVDYGQSWTRSLPVATGRVSMGSSRRVSIFRESDGWIGVATFDGCRTWTPIDPK